MIYGIFIKVSHYVKLYRIILAISSNLSYPIIFSHFNVYYKLFEYNSVKPTLRCCILSSFNMDDNFRRDYLLNYKKFLKPTNPLADKNNRIFFDTIRPFFRMKDGATRGIPLQTGRNRNRRINKDSFIVKVCFDNNYHNILNFVSFVPTNGKLTLADLELVTSHIMNPSNAQKFDISLDLIRAALKRHNITESATLVELRCMCIIY